MGDMKEKEASTGNDYSKIRKSLINLKSICEAWEESGRFELKDEQLEIIELIRDKVDEIEQIMGTNYKVEYKDNLECLDIFRKRVENQEPNNATWLGYYGNLGFVLDGLIGWINKLIECIEKMEPVKTDKNSDFRNSQKVGDTENEKSGEQNVGDSTRNANEPTEEFVQE